jgi:hypothetical protein
MLPTSSVVPVNGSSRRDLFLLPVQAAATEIHSALSLLLAHCFVQVTKPLTPWWWPERVFTAIACVQYLYIKYLI